MKDYDKVWDIFHFVVSGGDTYVFEPNTPKSALRHYWFADYMDAFVAEEKDEILGTYIIKPNQTGLGDHIANCSYMVGENSRHQGVGKAMCAHSIDFARREGYKGIQFNFVVSTNTRAINLWKKFGFKIIGTIPRGYRHQQLGYVDAYIMFKEL